MLEAILEFDAGHFPKTGQKDFHLLEAGFR
jgi:hypothetical protein